MHPSDGDDKRRLPEHTASAMYVAHCLHEKVRARSTRSAGAGARAAVGADPALERLELSVKQAVIRAASATREKEVRQAIVALARGEGFFALSVRIQRQLLAVLVDRPATRELAAELACFAEDRSFAKLPRPLQALVLEELARHTGIARAIRALIATPGFFELDEREQLALLRYAAGPRANEEARQSYLDRVWEDRRGALARFVESASFRREPAEEQAEQLHDFLHLPAPELYFVQALSFDGPAGLIFGDPAGERALSYLRRHVIGPGNRARSTITSPGEPGGAAGDQTFAFEMCRLTRDEERQLVSWIENTYVINEGSRGRVRYINCKRFYDAALEMVGVMTSVRGGVELESGYLENGRRCAAPQPSDVEIFCDEMLRDYLCA